ncbi:nucleolin isoform X2 [Elgaria multicarinata webbii]|uniref:nucleolin isoform X2 n=1 Tax=Elgaria multicarinata webbii TaxID=159646 RepID=UPI002FCCC523
MVKLAKNVKNQLKPKKMAALPPKDIDDSEEEEDSSEEESSEEEMIAQKKAATPAKAAAVTPNKKAATPGKKAVATPAKKAVATPAKKGAATPAKKTPVPAKGAKNGKNAKKEESEEEEEDDEEEDDSEEEEDESDEEPAVPVKKQVQAAAKKPVATVAAITIKNESDLEDEDDDEDEDDEEDESEEEPMDTTPAKGKKAVLAKAARPKVTPAKLAKEESEEEEDEEDDDDEEEEEDDDDDEEENVQETAGKRKKEMAKQKGIPDAKKKKTDEAAFSLFVGNLNATKDFDELKAAIRDFFAKKDLQVQEVRIGSSKKFGYVDFSTEAELDKALKFNGKKCMGLEIKLEKAKSKESIQENKKERDARTIFVRNLAYSVTQEGLQEVFDNAREVRLVSKDGNSKGFAYIEFKSEADAEKALEEKQGMEIEGRAIVIDYTGEKSQQDSRKAGGESKTLVVNNLSYDATEESLQEVFEKATSIRMPQNNQGRSKGYAFVEFPTAEDAKEALNSCNNTEIEGRTIRLEFSTPGGQNRNANARGGFGQQSKTLFVKGLSEDTTEETLRESFEGSIGARIVTDRDTGSSKGFGFVDFGSAEDAKAAKEAMEDGEIDGNKVTLDFAKPKGDGPRGSGGFGRGGRGGRGGGRGFGGRGGGFRGGRGGGGDHKPQGKKIKFDD